MAQAMSGHWVSSRASRIQLAPADCSTWPDQVAIDKDGILTVSTVTDPSGAPRKWRAIGPWLWQEVNGDRLAAGMPDANGKVKMFSITPFAPIIEFVPAPTSLNAGWILPVAGLAILDDAGHGDWLADRRARPQALQICVGSGAAVRSSFIARRASRRGCSSSLMVGWFIIFSLINKDLAVLDSGLDIWMRLLQLILVARHRRNRGCNLERMDRGPHPGRASRRDDLVNHHRGFCGIPRLALPATLAC